MAQAFDLSRLTLTGEARTITGNVSSNPVISASAGGLLAFGGGTPPSVSSGSTDRAAHRRYQPADGLTT
jgi:hypothetical protein